MTAPTTAETQVREKLAPLVLWPRGERESLHHAHGLGHGGGRGLWVGGKCWALPESWLEETEK